MQKLRIPFVAMLMTLPIFSAMAGYVEESSVKPYLALRMSYLFFNVDGGQDTYAAPLGVVGAKLGSERFDIDGDSSLGVKLAFGGSMNVPKVFGHIKLEAEYGNNGRFATDINSENASAAVDFTAENTTLFANAYYYLNTGTRFSPYLGTGLGLSHFSSTTSYNDGEFHSYMSNAEYKFGWQAGLGIGVHLARGAYLDLGYRYSDLGKFTDGADVKRYSVCGGNICNSVALRNEVDLNFKAHEIIFGFRYEI